MTEYAKVACNLDSLSVEDLHNLNNEIRIELQLREKAAIEKAKKRMLNICKNICDIDPFTIIYEDEYGTLSAANLLDYLMEESGE